jgi:cysteine synthase A
MVTSGQPQPRDENGDPLSGHPAWKPHPQQGWSPDFIPKLAGDALAENKIDQVITVENAEAMKCSKDLARQEGIFVGITSGATFAGALKIAEKAPKGSTILCMLPDTGERYLSTPLFADVGVDMNDEEIAISKSTPSAQLPPT